MTDLENIIRPDRNKYFANTVIYFIISQLALNVIIILNMFIKIDIFYLRGLVINILIAVFIIFTAFYISSINKFFTSAKTLRNIELYKNHIQIGIFTSEYKDIYLKIVPGVNGKILTFKTPSRVITYDYPIKESDLNLILKKIKVYETSLN